MAIVPVKAGARELLAYLASRGLPLAIATSSRAATVERHLGRAGLLGHFQAIATRYDVERPKPHPDVYLEAARRLGVAPARCMYVGDDERDILAGRAAGMRTVAATYGYMGEQAEAALWDADAAISSPLELLQWLKQA